jgi:hypothetical protein
LGLLVVSFLIDPAANTYQEVFDSAMRGSAVTTANIEAERGLFDLAATQSNGFFGDAVISNAAWRRLQQRTAGAPQYRFPAYPTRAFGVPARWWIKNVQPLLTCPHLVRLGGHGSVAPEAEGVFGLCAAPLPVSSRRKTELTKDSSQLQAGYDCLVYAIGYSGGWEEDTSTRYPSCEIHVLDPRPLLTGSKGNLHFHPWGVVSAYTTSTVVDATAKVAQSGAIYATLREIRQRLGHGNRTLDVLKVDCGTGCAWSLHRDWIEAAPTQLVVQLHGLPSPHGPNAFHADGPLNVATVLGRLASSHDGGGGGYLLYDKVYRRTGVRVVLGWLRVHDDFWKAAEAIRKRATD